MLLLCSAEIPISAEFYMMIVAAIVKLLSAYRAENLLVRCTSRAFTENSKQSVETAVHIVNSVPNSFSAT